MADKVFTPVLDKLTQWGDAAVSWVAGTAKSVGKAVSGFFHSIFG